MYLSLSIYIYIYMYCVYVYIYIYIHTYTHIRGPRTCREPAEVVWAMAWDPGPTSHYTTEICIYPSMHIYGV